MPYSPDIPVIDHTLIEDQPAFLENFSEIDRFMSVNHHGLTEAAGLIGKHGMVNFFPLTGNAVTTATQMAINSSISTITLREELFVTPPYSGDPIEFTSSINEFFGFTRLPSGMAYRWGRGSVLANDTSLINIQLHSIDDFSEIFSVLITPIGEGLGDGAITVDGIWLTEFLVRSTYNENVDLYYLAIGR